MTIRSLVAASTIALAGLISGCGSGGAAGTDLAVAPPATTVGLNGTAQFKAMVNGAASAAVSWSLQESANCGSVSSGGFYTAPGAPSTCHVVVKSSADPTKSAVATVTVSSTGGLFLGGYFPIGVFMQNHDTFQKWHDRGVNMLMGEPNWTMEGMTHDQFIQFWDAEAAKLGMRTIRRPLSNPALDIGSTTLLAWAQDDEPDAAGAGITNLPSFVSIYNTLKAVDPSRPVYLNFAGPDVVIAVGGPKDPPPSWCTAPDYNCSTVKNHVDYIEQTLDWVSNDIYPYTGWLPDEGRRGDPTYVADPLDLLRSWTDKPQFNFIETSNQYFVSTGTGITPGGLRAEIWLSIIHGTRGFVYFPQVVAAVGGTPDTDGTPADVAAEMTTQNGIVTQLATTLQGAINPSTLSATVPSPLQAGWRDTAGAAYFFVVNPRNATASNARVTLTGIGSATSATVYNESRTVAISSGALTDTFGPYAVHIYVVAK